MTDDLLVSAIDVERLTYSFTHDLEPALEDVTLTLHRGSRCLVIGANGAGKSTLLRILAGKRLIKGAKCSIFGHDVFNNLPGGVVYLGTEWSSNPVVRGDIVVSDFLDSVGGYRHKERRDRLLRILDVDVDWHMHQISDGERRRVQLCMGLMGHWDVLLLDEVTVDLDVLVRADLIEFLVEESKIRNATILYATHIFDGLSSFPTHICHLQLGTALPLLPWPLAIPSGDASTAETDRDPDSLFHLALEWLREDRNLRRGRDSARGKHRGPKAETTNARTFFEKYDYAH
ncbi:hypothetical protein TREMEDRAFT_69861 [Tremella mesenterica DSM 1558]|uniref:uncharacterized protein n=1 Tax=Tremella mesenterica (strain ATCC 24925 / CBS 8224 / DSM 1558 / NBRC 9311 / NRRL Y-6157 / RJB 2259-6 / UBC 559-6) TaxID=578456 RepID=UPI0003F49D95|nr:uncharacterized protein TREMEDRAFT_69861 [Tremella mesenterica DSM 1558]EIW67448.1 hypothetical protein TREMEDRAFT_69861 [Tremella mesenterica DSM 1558]